MIASSPTWSSRVDPRCMEYEVEERPSADETRAWLEVNIVNVDGDAP